jgi:hypothetical protein
VGTSRLRQQTSFFVIHGVINGVIDGVINGAINNGTDTAVFD